MGIDTVPLEGKCDLSSQIKEINVVRWNRWAYTTWLQFLLLHLFESESLGLKRSRYSDGFILENVAMHHYSNEKPGEAKFRVLTLLC